MSERRSDAILPFVLFSRPEAPFAQMTAPNQVMGLVAFSAFVKPPPRRSLQTASTSGLGLFDEVPDRRRQHERDQFGAPVLQGESGPQDGNQCRAPAFRGHSFAACIHFLVGRFLSARIRRCKKTKFLTVRSRVGPTPALRWLSAGPFL
jgi:hypothetical protein